MKCHKSYLIANFENFSPDTLKMADICCYGVWYGNPLFTHCCTVRRNSKFPPSLLTSGLNRTPVYAAALIKQCLIQKITAGSY